MRHHGIFEAEAASERNPWMPLGQRAIQDGTGIVQMDLVPFRWSNTTLYLSD